MIIGRTLAAASVIVFAGAHLSAAQTSGRGEAPPGASGSATVQPRDGDQAQQLSPGVLRPPQSIDPAMTKPAPDPKAFPTPVLPPPTPQSGKEDPR